MRKGTLLIILFILVSAGCALLGSKQIGAQSKGPTAFVTESCIEFDKCGICREHDPETGLVKKIFFDGKNKSVTGIEADLWICDGEITIKSDPKSPEGPECRQLIHTLELFGCTNPGFGCGGWACSFWP